MDISVKRKEKYSYNIYRYIDRDRYIFISQTILRVMVISIYISASNSNPMKRLATVDEALFLSVDAAAIFPLNGFS